MIELQRHIEVLLLTNDCVIVPGLGGFMAHHIEARFDEEDNTFVPPLRTLGFNQNLTINDSLLVQSYIECHDISYPEALHRIEGEVEELRQHLQTDGRYELNDIGVLSLNAEGNLSFAPCEAGILTPALYGLGAFEMLPLQAQKTEASKAETHPQEQQGQTTAMDEEERERAIVIKMSWLRHAVVVAAAVVAFFMIGTPVSNSYMDSQQGVQQSSFIPISTQAAPAAGEADAADMPADGVQESADAAQAHTAGAADEAPESVATAGDEYCIVLACQVSRKNAEGFVELLSKSGYTDGRIADGKFRRVVYGSYATKDDALEQLRQLRRESKKLFGEGWVMKI